MAGGGTGATTVSRWESAVRVPDVGVLAALAEALSVSADWLIGRDAGAEATPAPPQQAGADVDELGVLLAGVARAYVARDEERVEAVRRALSLRPAAPAVRPRSPRPSTATTPAPRPRGVDVAPGAVDRKTGRPIEGDEGRSEGRGGRR